MKSAMHIDKHRSLKTEYRYRHFLHQTIESEKTMKHKVYNEKKAFNELFNEAQKQSDALYRTIHQLIDMKRAMHDDIDRIELIESVSALFVVVETHEIN